MYFDQTSIGVHADRRSHDQQDKKWYEIYAVIRTNSTACIIYTVMYIYADVSCWHSNHCVSASNLRISSIPFLTIQLPDIGYCLCVESWCHPQGILQLLNWQDKLLCLWFGWDCWGNLSFNEIHSQGSHAGYKSFLLSVYIYYLVITSCADFSLWLYIYTTSSKMRWAEWCLTTQC